MKSWNISAIWCTDQVLASARAAFALKSEGEYKFNWSLCSLARSLSFSAVACFCSPITHVYTCLQVRTHTRTHTHAYHVSHHPPANWHHLFLCTHTSVTIICMQSGWRRWVAMVAVTRVCDKKRQVALPLICANLRCRSRHVCWQNPWVNSCTSWHVLRQWWRWRLKGAIRWSCN